MIKLSDKQKEVIEEMRKDNICMYKHSAIGTKYNGHYEVWDSVRHRQVLRVRIATGNKLRDLGIITFIPNSMQDYFRLTELGNTIDISLNHKTKLP